MNMKIVIVGQAKSGTTALFHVLKQSLPGGYRLLFEPTGYRGPHKERVLAKVLINPGVALGDFDGFEKKILIIRDPRDNLVSRLLYAIYDNSFIMDDARLYRFVALVERKQNYPKDVSLRALFELLNDLSEGNVLERALLSQKAAMAFEDAHAGYHRYRYEDLVARSFSGIEHHLGMSLRFNGEVDPEYSRVTRTRTAGDWRNWFTESDIEYFRAELHHYMIRYGYDTNWIPESNPRIAPEHASQYLLRLAREKRRMLGVTG